MNAPLHKAKHIYDFETLLS